MVLNNLCSDFPFNVVKNNWRTHALRKMQQAIDDSHPWFWSFEIYYGASVLAEISLKAFQLHGCFIYLSLQAYSLVCKFLAGGGFPGFSMQFLGFNSLPLFIIQFVGL